MALAAASAGVGLQLVGKVAGAYLNRDVHRPGARFRRAPPHQPRTRAACPGDRAAGAGSDWAGTWRSPSSQESAVGLGVAAGYVGYYSGVTLYDYPGLTSRGALGALEELGPRRNSLSDLANAIRPEWLVLRPNEWTELKRDYPSTAAHYAPARAFAVSDDDPSLSYLGGPLSKHRSRVPGAQANAKIMSCAFAVRRPLQGRRTGRVEGTSPRATELVLGIRQNHRPDAGKHVTSRVEACGGWLQALPACPSEWLRA